MRQLIEGLEFRVHRGPPIHAAEIHSARELLRQRGFSSASDYFGRLVQLGNRLQARNGERPRASLKRNYGGEAAGRLMQVQSVFDHIILSTCYEGNSNGRHGRVKISHRFNQQGRIDFVELKFLRSLHPPLNGELRKLLMVKGYEYIRKDWLEAGAVGLRILPQELIFLYEDVFQSERDQVLAWLVNIGHGIVADLLSELKSHRTNGSPHPGSGGEAGGEDFDLSDLGQDDDGDSAGWLAGTRNGNGNGTGSGNGGRETVCLEQQRTGLDTVTSLRNDANGEPLRNGGGQGQLHLAALAQDEVAWPILEKAAGLEAAVELTGPAEVVVRYVRR